MTRRKLESKRPSCSVFKWSSDAHPVTVYNIRNLMQVGPEAAQDLCNIVQRATEGLFYRHLAEDIRAVFQNLSLTLMSDHDLKSEVNEVDEGEVFDTAEMYVSKKAQTEGHPYFYQFSLTGEFDGPILGYFPRSREFFVTACFDYVFNDFAAVYGRPING